MLYEWTDSLCIFGVLFFSLNIVIFVEYCCGGFIFTHDVEVLVSYSSLFHF